MKTVLLSFSDRNKVFTIPCDFPRGDLAYLEEKFRESFSFENNVSIEISFHKYSSTWEEYVEITEDDDVADKDKLKAVVTPRIVTPLPSIGSSQPAEEEDYVKSKQIDDDFVKSKPISRSKAIGKSKPIDEFVPTNREFMKSKRKVAVIESDEEDDLDVFRLPPKFVKPKPKLYEGCDEAEELMMIDVDGSRSEWEENIESFDADSLANNASESSSLNSVNVNRKRKRTVKSEEDAVPLTDPFPLPKHYSTEVEVALKAKRMSMVTRQDFLGKVASSMLYYKRYPSSADYANVGRTIIQKYPFLRSPVGSPAVSYP